MTPWLILASVGAAIPLVAWLGYPWTMIHLSERRRAVVPAPVPEPDLVSVIVATREPPDAVRARLVDVLAGAWPANRLEVIVAIDGDPAPYRFEGLSPAPGRLAVVSGPAPGKASALNAGVAVAAGSVLVFTDTAQRFLPDAIPRLVLALSGPRLGAVSGALEIGGADQAGSPIARYWRLEKRLRSAEARVHSAIGVTGAIYAMRRALWQPLPEGLILDDLWIPMQLVLNGHRVGFEPDAVARDIRVTDAAQEYRRKVRTLTGNLQLVAWLPAVLLPWQNPVWLQFLCHKLLRLATPYALLMMVVGTTGATFATSSALGWWLLGLGGAALAMVLLLPLRQARAARHALAWGLAMQGATVMATVNGLRGRWNVWHR